MILIGERINSGFKEIREAIVNKDEDVIKEWAKKQADAKATYLDVNIGTASAKVDDFLWLVDLVQNAVDLPLSLDHNKIPVLIEAMKICKKPPLVNSITAIDEKMDQLFPAIAEYKASVIGLVMDESGSPKSTDKRVENAGKIFAKIMEYGISPEQLFLDPIIMPLKYMQDQAKEILLAASQFQLFSNPPCHIVGGLSNVSNGTTKKKLINRTFCIMLIAHGLDAVILDVMDTELVDAILTAELIMNKSIYADSYIEAFRK
ncbi:MAG: dihydropteroate synthase [Spirochaetales bacterium]|nr:dihydropteroate synthase [Spirochaetales bacterium]